MLPSAKLVARARDRVNERVAALRLPDLPPRDLERLAAQPHSAPLLPAPHSAPLSLPPPLITPTKFHPDLLPGNERSPADVRAFSASAPLLVRGLISPSRSSAPLVLPSLALPSANGSLPPPPQPLLPPVSMSAAVMGVAPAASPPPPGLTERALSARASTTPSSPVTAQMTQNEIKKAQNRKSAKRFREAQKQRWKNMADDLLRQKKVIETLRAQLAAQASSMAHMPPPCHSTHHAHHHAQQLGVDRRAMSIHDLVHASEPQQQSCPPSCSAATAAAAAAAAAASAPGADVMGAGSTSHLQSEAEASLYAQILSTFSQNKSASGNGSGGAVTTTTTAHVSQQPPSQNGGEGDGIGAGCGSGGEMGGGARAAAAQGRKLPYACDLGVLTCCFVVVSSNARITAIRRGDVSGCSTFATDGLGMTEQGEFRKAMQCGSPISVAYHRGGAKVIGVMNPISGTDRVIVAEFAPLE